VGVFCGSILLRPSAERPLVRALRLERSGEERVWGEERVGCGFGVRGEGDRREGRRRRKRVQEGIGVGGWVGVGRGFSGWRWLPAHGGGIRWDGVIIVGRPCGHRCRAGPKARCVRVRRGRARARARARVCGMFAFVHLFMRSCAC
jgi:hypothetical protein